MGLVDIGDRRKYIGGSDLHNIFNIAPYGCARRLWYEKKGVPPDYAIVRNPLFERGHDLEDIVAIKFQSQTGIKPRKSKKAFSWDAFWFFQGHVDRILPKKKSFPGGVGILEIKTANKYVCLQIKASGVSIGYILQLQAYLWLSGLKWGCFAIFNVDKWELMEPIYQNENKELQKEIKEKVTTFWNKNMVGNKKPLPLEDGSKQCMKCNWRISCRDKLIAPKEVISPEEIDNSVYPYVKNFMEAREAFLEAKEHKEEMKRALLCKIGERDIVRAKNVIVENIPYERKCLDIMGMKEKYPDEVTSFEKTTICKRLIVKEK